MSASLRKIAGDLGEPYELTLGISHGRDDDVCPEQGPVLLDTPTLVFEYPCLGRYLEFVLRHSACQRLRRVEPRKMLPDDLVGSISLEPLGPCIPRQNVTAGIQHENRIFPDALNEELETLLTLPQFFFWFAALLACHISYKLTRRPSMPRARVPPIRA